MMMDNNELIQQARELCEKATPGPWKSKETADYSEIYDNHSWGKALNPLAMVGSNLEDAAFIAASRTIVPQLCDALEAAQKENAGLRANGMIQEHIITGGRNPMDADTIIRLTMDKAELTARAEKAEAERDTYRAALQNWHEAGDTP